MMNLQRNFIKTRGLFPILYFRGPRYDRYRLGPDFQNRYALSLQVPMASLKPMEDLAQFYHAMHGRSEDFEVYADRIESGDHLMFPFWTYDLLLKMFLRFPNMDHRCICLEGKDGLPIDSYIFNSIGVAVSKPLEPAV